MDINAALDALGRYLKTTINDQANDYNEETDKIESIIDSIKAWAHDTEGYIAELQGAVELLHTTMEG